VNERPPAGAATRTLVAWMLYDFANSAFAAVVVATIWAAYYANGVVGNEHGAGDLWWGAVVSTSMGLVALTSPLLGGLADRSGLRRTLLVAFTLLAVAATAGMSTVRPGMVVWGFVLGVLGNVGFESAIVYYNAYLPDLAPPGRRGRVSSWGFAVGYAGSIVALLAAYPFVSTERFGGAFLTTAALFLGFALPSFVLLPPTRGAGVPVGRAAREGFSHVAASLRRIAGQRDLRRFFLAYLVYEDGVNTVISFSAVFAAHTLKFPMAQLIVLYILVQFSALAGALFWAKRCDRLGPKRVVLVTLVQWAMVAVAAYFVQTQMWFYVVAILAGTGLGAIQAASRALLTTLIRPGEEAEMFGFYALCGKSAAILGPIVFGLVSRAAGGNQRLGILAISAFFAIGFVLLRRVEGGGPHVAA
jgi:UMF1 family MFS transporter